LKKVFVILAAAFLVGGCKKSAEAPKLAPAQETQVEAQFVGVTNLNAPIEDRLQGAVNAELTMRLQVFRQVKGRMPETFMELAYFGSDSVPPLPLTMKYVIDPKDKTVKAVKK
jgi:hypothetical protein